MPTVGIPDLDPGPGAGPDRSPQARVTTTQARGQKPVQEPARAALDGQAFRGDVRQARTAGPRRLAGERAACRPVRPQGQGPAHARRGMRQPVRLEGARRGQPNANRHGEAARPGSGAAGCSGGSNARCPRGSSTVFPRGSKAGEEKTPSEAPGEAPEMTAVCCVCARAPPHTPPRCVNARGGGVVWARGHRRGEGRPMTPTTRTLALLLEQPNDNQGEWPGRRPHPRLVLGGKMQ